MRDDEEIRPDFARGMDDESASDRGARRFSEGQEREPETHEKEHESSFAEGQADEPHHQEGGLHGRFSRGQESGSR